LVFHSSTCSNYYLFIIYGYFTALAVASNKSFSVVPGRQGCCLRVSQFGVLQFGCCNIYTEPDANPTW